MRVLIDKSIGYIATPQPVQLVDDKGNVLRGEGAGKLTIESVQYIYSLLLSLAQAINGNLVVGDGSPGSKSGNLLGQWIPVFTPTPADTEFAVDHALGHIPVAVLCALTDQYVRLKVSSHGSWTDDRIYLKCDAAGATLRLWLL